MSDQVVERSPVPKSRDGKIHWWDILIVLVGGNVAGAILIVILVAAVVVSIRYYHYAPISLNNISKSFPATMAAVAATDLGILSVFWLVARRRFRPVFSHYFVPIRARTVGWAAMSGFFLAATLIGFNELLSRWGLVKFNASDFELSIIPHNASQFVVAIAMSVLFAPFVEELLFRGLVLEWLRRIGGAWVGVLLSAAFFSLSHFELLFHPGTQGWIYSADIFLIGVAMAAWVVRTGSLRSSLAVHASYNAIAVLGPALLSWHS